MTRAPATGHIKKGESGLSIVELMISLLISTLILAGLTQVFTTNRATHQSDEGMARLQENARFALDFLQRDLRVAGNMGCLSPSSIKGTVADTSGSGFNLGTLRTPIRGHDATGLAAGASTYTLPSLYPPALTGATNPPLDLTLAPVGGVAEGSDAILVQTMDSEVYGMFVPPNPPTSYTGETGNTYTLPGSPVIANGQIILATDCANASISRVLGLLAVGPNTILNITPYTIGPSGFDLYQAQVASLRTVLYYVGVGSNNGPALFSRNFSDGIGAPQELVEGVENLQFLYGVNTAGNTLYTPAALVTDWTRVNSVRIAMLVATSNIVTGRDYTPTSSSGGTERAPDANIYTMLGVAITPNADNRRRRVFESTVRTRNMGTD